MQILHMIVNTLGMPWTVALVIGIPLAFNVVKQTRLHIRKVNHRFNNPKMW